MKVDIVDEEPLVIHAMRYEGQVAQIGRVWRKLWEWAVESNLAQRIDLAVGMCRDAPDARGNVVYHAGLALRGAPSSSGDVEILEVPGGRYARYRLHGPYEVIARAFPKLYGEWLPASGYAADDRPALELYRNNPYDTPEQELITDLLVPIK